jgi:serine/threonine-protein kinase
MSAAVPQLVDILREGQLLEPAQWEELSRSPLISNPDQRALAKELLQRNWLTSFQVNLLLQGKGKELLLGPFRLLDRLGEGNMGKVFKARHIPTQKIYALKMLHKERVPDAATRDQLYKEISAIQQQPHPHVVLIMGIAQLAEAHVLIMEYVEGMDLGRVMLQKGPMPVEQAWTCMRQAALGLQFFHEKSRIHRDIKPSALMLAQSVRADGSPGPPVVKVLGLGLAQLQVPAMDCLAPEVANDPLQADIRSDLYSLGCTAFYLLTGQPPFTGATATELRLKHQSAQPTSLGKLRPDVPTTLQMVIRKLLSKSPIERFQNPAELAAGLEALPRTKSGLLMGSAPPRPAPKSAPGLAARPSGTPANVIELDESMMVPTEGPVPPRPAKSGSGSVAAIIGCVGLVGGILVIGGLVLAAWLIPDLNPFATKPDQGDDVVINSPPPEPVAQPGPVDPDPKPTPKVEPKGKQEPKVEPKQEPRIEPKVEPKAEPKVEPKTEPKPENKPLPKPKPKPKPVSTKMAVPDPIKQASAEKTVKAAYKFDYAKSQPSDRLALANKLLTEGINTKDDPVARFVLLREARDLAATAPQLDQAMQAVTQLDKFYAIDLADMRIATLDKVSKSTALPPTIRAIVGASLALADDMVDEGNYEAADRLATLVTAIVKKANSPPLTNYAQMRTKEIADIRKAYTSAKSAADTLKKKPDDSQANTQWGKFVSCTKGDWGRGLPLLAQGSDKRLQSLAEKDLANPTEPAEHVELGDSWWDLGDKEPGAAQRQLQLRARYWYDQAAPKLTGFTKTKVATRLKQLDAMPKYEPATKAEAVMPNPGKIACKQARYDAAIEAYGKAVEADPDDAKAAIALGQAKYLRHLVNGLSLMKAKRNADAAKEFYKAWQEKPDDAAAESLYLQAFKQAESTPAVISPKPDSKTDAKP